MSHCEIEPLTMLARVWSDGKGFGDPYDWCITMTKTAHRCYECQGTTKSPTPSQWRALRDACERSGIHEVVFRRADGRLRTVTIREFDEQGELKSLGRETFWDKVRRFLALDKT